MRRYLTALALGVMLAAPVVTIAQEHDRRYYDKERKDYHEWNEREDRAYRHWLEEQHRPYHRWARANERERREYWRWRHEHEDWH